MTFWRHVRSFKWSNNGPAYITNHISPSSTLILAPGDFRDPNAYLDDMLKHWARVGGWTCLAAVGVGLVPGVWHLSSIALTLPLSIHINLAILYQVHLSGLLMPTVEVKLARFTHLFTSAPLSVCLYRRRNRHHLSATNGSLRKGLPRDEFAA